MFRFCSCMVLIMVVLGCGSPSTDPDPRVHAFYYPWYGTPRLDGQYRHWAHDQMGSVQDRIFYPGGEDIGADFFPAGGCYSSGDPEVLDRHMKELRQAMVGSFSVSWWGVGSFEDQQMPALFNAAATAGLKVSLHLEPLPGRDAAMCRKALRSFFDRFADHEALYRVPGSGLPLVFVYDSYLSSVQEWQKLLTPEGEYSIRGTELDCEMIGLWVEKQHGTDLHQAGFDGMYSYFATDGFTYGSTTNHWPAMAAFAHEHHMTFVPCVGPGYADLRIRPWNTANQRDRRGGDYYRRMAAAALAVKPTLIGLTSFNEWHEGTQIEPAQPHLVGGFRYRDYGSLGQSGYLELTRQWLREFSRKSSGG